MNQKELLHLLDELVEGQKRQLLKEGEKILPHITSDDILQPNDFPKLEHNPLFRYEEGYLAGLQASQIAVMALLKESVS